MHVLKDYVCDCERERERFSAYISAFIFCCEGKQFRERLQNEKPRRKRRKMGLETLKRKRRKRGGRNRKRRRKRKIKVEEAR